MIVDVLPVRKNIFDLYYVPVYYKRKKNKSFKFERELKDFKTIEAAEDYRYHMQKRMWKQQEQLKGLER